MIETILTPARDAITALAWTSHYGGIARPVSFPVEGADNNIIKKTFPVRKDLSQAACIAENRMYDLVPNDAYANLLYFEQLEDLRQARTESSRSMKFAGRVRLVYWLNLPKMGVQQANQMEVQSAVSSVLTAVLDDNFPINQPFPSRIEYSSFSIVKSSEEIFKNYSYDANMSAMLLYPYDFGAIDFMASIDFNKSCINEFNLGPQIDCVTGW